jgi:hypothetical protein
LPKNGLVDLRKKWDDLGQENGLKTLKTEWA